MSDVTLGFIGQGWIGKNYADDLEERGYRVIRYSLESEHQANRARIAECDIVFIAVPTPTTQEGFDIRIVESVLPLVGKGKTAVIKSTMVPGTTERLQEEFPDIRVFHSPEFLSKKTAREEARSPERNIVGIPRDTPDNRMHAQQVLSVLPKAPYEKICSAREAEFIKYTRNTFSYVMIVFANILYDTALGLDLDWSTVADAMRADPHIPDRYTEPVHQGGRGAGGCCFIKDFEAFIQYCEPYLDDTSKKLVQMLREKNLELLKASGKDSAHVEDVYGK